MDINNNSNINWFYLIKGGNDSNFDKIRLLKDLTFKEKPFS